MVRLIPLEIVRLYNLLPHSYRLRLWGVGMSVFLMSVLDLLGTGVLLPVLLLVLNEKTLLENHYLALFYNWAGSKTPVLLYSSFVGWFCFFQSFV